jgi:signal transduction histidine kinase
VTAALFPLLTIVVACYVALLALRYRKAPTLPGQAWFAGVALTGAAFCACNLVTYGGWAADALVDTAARIQIFFATLHVGAWLFFSSAQLRRPGRLDAAFAAGLTVLGALTLIPGVSMTGEVQRRTFPPLGFVYRDSETTAFGDAVVGAVLLGLSAILGRYVRAWRRGERQAGVQALAMGALLLMAVNDGLVLAGAYQGPYVLDLGFLLPVAAVGWALGAQVVADAAALEQLRRSLEQQVAERTAELARSQASLMRAEKLAALGQLAAGVAHEVNNPTAVAAANLAYLEDGLAGSGRPPDDALESVRESRAAVARIARIVRQLLDTSRLAAAAERPGQPFSLAEACRAALKTARPRLGDARVEAALAEGLVAHGDEQGFVQVVANLLVNAAQSYPGGRPVRIQLESSGDAGRVRVRVRDDGAGMDAETLRRVFEPFFTTKPFGVGTGLGLAVSRGLLQGMGGDLELASAPGVGTTATVTLRASEERPAAGTAGPPAPAGARLRLLVVDDQADVRAAIRRALDGRFQVQVADGVEAGLRALGEGASFDLLLCDVMMPGGGAEAFAARVDAERPELSARLAFLTGGATTDEARAFLARERRPVLAKPLDVAELARLAERLAPPRG